MYTYHLHPSLLTHYLDTAPRHLVVCLLTIEQFLPKILDLIRSATLRGTDSSLPLNLTRDRKDYFFVAFAQAVAEAVYKKLDRVWDRLVAQYPQFQDMFYGFTHLMTALVALMQENELIRRLFLINLFSSFR